MEKSMRFCFASLLILLLAASDACAIGVSPAKIVADNLIRGGYAEKTILISTAGSDSLTVRIEAGGDARSWISFEPNESQLTVSREAPLPVVVKVNVPNTVQNGYYEGTVIISTMYRGDAAATMSEARFMAGLIVRVQLNVTGDEIRGYDVKSVLVKDTEQNQLLEVSLVVGNTGNVIVTPRIRVSLLDSEKKETGKFIDYSDTTIPPTVEKHFTVKMPTKGIGTGLYYAKVTSDNSEEYTIPFQILRPGTLAVSGVLEQLSVNKVWVNPDETSKLEASFRNNGESLIESAKLRGEAYLIDPVYGTKELAGVFEGEPMSVSTGEEVKLTAYFTPKKSGLYSIEGVVIYGGRKTEPKSTMLNVLGQKQSSIPQAYVYAIIAAAAVVILLLVYATRMNTGSRTAMQRKEAAYAPKPAAGEGAVAGRKSVTPFEVIYRRLKSELGEIKKDYIVLVSCESQQHTEAVASLLKILVNENKMGCLYLSVSKPYEQLAKLIESNNIDTSSMLFIDCISYIAGKAIDKSENTVFVENPSSLEEVSLYLDKMLARTPQPKVVIVDSLSTLLIYNTETSVEELIHRIVNKISIEKAAGVILSIKQKEVEALTKTLGPLCDKEIIL
jgi:archaellum biogenesis ATPase FlaH